MRCSDCNKFVSYDEPEAEVQGVSVHDGTAAASVRVVLRCGDCGGELKDNDFDTEAEFEHKCKPKEQRNPAWTPDEDFKPGDDQFKVEDDGEADGESRTETKDRNGKPIKSARYMKQFYGYTLESEIKCRKCGEVFTVSFSDEEQASCFNELC